MEKISIKMNPKEYFKKMSVEDSAFIVKMCIDKLCAKAEELKDLYKQLVNTYGIEMGICDITLLVQVSASALPDTPVSGMLGTSKGIKHALSTMMNAGLKKLAKIEEEEKNG